MTNTPTSTRLDGKPEQDPRAAARGIAQAMTTLAQVCVALFGLGGIIGGIILSVQRLPGTEGEGLTTSHPFLPIGLAMAFIIATVAAFAMAVLQYVEYRLVSDRA